MTADIWPPPGYFWSKNPTITTRDRTDVLVPLEAVALGEVMRYQLPETPAEPGSVFVDGHLYSLATGELLDQDGTLAGSVDFDTGMIEIDTSVSPGLSSRRAQYVVAA